MTLFTPSLSLIFIPSLIYYYICTAYVLSLFPHMSHFLSLTLTHMYIGDSENFTMRLSLCARNVLLFYHHPPPISPFSFYSLSLYFLLYPSFKLLSISSLLYIATTRLFSLFLFDFVSSPRLSEKKHHIRFFKISLSISCMNVWVSELGGKEGMRKNQRVEEMEMKKRARKVDCGQVGFPFYYKISRWVVVERKLFEDIRCSVWIVYMLLLVEKSILFPSN